MLVKINSFSLYFIKMATSVYNVYGMDLWSYESKKARGSEEIAFKNCVLLRRIGYLEPGMKIRDILHVTDERNPVIVFYHNGALRVLPHSPPCNVLCDALPPAYDSNWVF